MIYSSFRQLLVVLCIATIALGSTPSLLIAQPESVTGRIAGRVYSKDEKMPLADVAVNALLITTNERYASNTNALGSYVIQNVPAGVYALTLGYEGKEFPVEGHFDIRAGMKFLLEGCFELDLKSQKALLQSECASGLYAETQVVSLGPHKFFRNEDLMREGTVQGTQTLAITHPGLACIVNDYFPQIFADFNPADRVQNAKVMFRAAQSPDYYYVDMVNTGAGFQAILPKPAPGTEQVVYYIEAIDRDFNPVVTPEFAPEVTDSETCERRDPEAAYYTGEDPGIAVGATMAGAASIPPGFLSAGIGSFISASGTVTYAVAGTAAATTGAGLGTTGLILIIGGAAGAAAVIGVIATREDEASPIQ
jgi:hypothetical protein